MKHIIIFFLILSILVMLASCKKNRNDEDVEETDNTTQVITDEAITEADKTEKSNSYELPPMYLG